MCRHGELTGSGHAAHVCGVLVLPGRLRHWLHVRWGWLWCGFFSLAADFAALPEDMPACAGVMHVHSRQHRRMPLQCIDYTP